MNERIQELTGQTLDKHFSHTWTVMDYEDVNRFAEKFAELIIRECMEVARQQRNPQNLNYKPSERFVEDLQQHFGVK